VLIVIFVTVASVTLTWAKYVVGYHKIMEIASGETSTAFGPSS